MFDLDSLDRMVTFSTCRRKFCFIVLKNAIFKMVNAKNAFTFWAWRRVVWLHLPVHRINLLPPPWDVDNFLPDCTASYSLIHHLSIISLSNRNNQNVFLGVNFRKSRFKNLFFPLLLL